MLHCLIKMEKLEKKLVLDEKSILNTFQFPFFARSANVVNKTRSIQKTE